MYGDVPPEGVVVMAPLFSPQDVFVALPLTATAVDVLMVVVAVAVHEGVPASDTVTVYVPGPTPVGLLPDKPPVQL